MQQPFLFRSMVITTRKWLISLSEFNQFSPLTFWKSRRAIRLNNFIPIQISGGQNWKLAALATEVPSVPALWAAQRGSYRGNLISRNIFGFMHHWATVSRFSFNRSNSTTRYWQHKKKWADIAAVNVKQWFWWWQIGGLISGLSLGKSGFDSCVEKNYFNTKHDLISSILTYRTSDRRNTNTNLMCVEPS